MSRMHNSPTHLILPFFSATPQSIPFLFHHLSTHALTTFSGALYLTNRLTPQLPVQNPIDPPLRAHPLPRITHNRLPIQTLQLPKSLAHPEAEPLPLVFPRQPQQAPTHFANASFNASVIFRIASSTGNSLNASISSSHASISASSRSSDSSCPQYSETLRIARARSAFMKPEVSLSSLSPISASRKFCEN